MDIQSALNVFQETTSISSSNLSLFVRTTLCDLFLLWAAWNIHGQIKIIQSQQADVYDLPMTILRVLLLCSLMIILVFIN